MIQKRNIAKIMFFSLAHMAGEESRLREPTVEMLHLEKCVEEWWTKMEIQSLHGEKGQKQGWSFPSPGTTILPSNWLIIKQTNMLVCVLEALPPTNLHLDCLIIQQFLL